MEAVLIRERYKIVRVLHAAEDFACVEAVDIQDRETPVYLINLYEGEFFHRYGKIYASMKQEDCPALRRLFLDGQTIAAVFEEKQGVNIDQLFYEGDNWNWRDRLAYAEALLHAALTLYNLPPELSCAAMLTENLFFNCRDVKVRFRYLIPPLEEMNARELTLLTCDQLKKILRRRQSCLGAELDFIEQLDRCDFPTVVKLYAAWRSAQDGIRAEYEEWEEKSMIGKWLAVAWLRIKRLFNRR